MPLRGKWMVPASVICSFLLVATNVALVQTSPNPSSNKSQRDMIVLSRSLPKLDGSNLKVTIVEVNYGPGESSKPHSHPCPVIGYVLEGKVRMKVAGESETTYRNGESFYEAPNGIHEVSANASQTEPAKFLAYFICDRETPLSVAAASKGNQ